MPQTPQFLSPIPQETVPVSIREAKGVHPPPHQAGEKRPRSDEAVAARARVAATAEKAQVLRDRLTFSRCQSLNPGLPPPDSVHTVPQGDGATESPLPLQQGAPSHDVFLPQPLAPPRVRGPFVSTVAPPPPPHPSHPPRGRPTSHTTSAARREGVLAKVFVGMNVLTDRMQSKGIDVIQIPDIKLGGPDLRTDSSFRAVVKQILGQARGL